MSNDKEAKNNCIVRGGNIGAYIRSMDWSGHSLGMMEHWPQPLKTTLSLLLNSRLPMFLFWGDDLICFYNDAFRPSLGNEGKHPKAIGARGEDVWPEIWSTIKPQIDQVLAGGRLCGRKIFCCLFTAMAAWKMFTGPIVTALFMTVPLSLSVSL